uniref:Uncharacterized protein n=1 Tax=Tetradesmus obliquus TaxID=3088 RepID=A0A383WHL5_TETOB|eukprot:jgi/Sobl393_1/8338/SZX76975.1
MDSTLTYQQRNTVQHQTQRGPQGLGTSLNPKPGTSRGRAQLRRQWTLCKHKPGPGGSSSSSSTVMAALPLPFMELSVSVMDTLDLLRSSVEEEIVFQATLQVPAHHAIACRIDAYDTPFANAPALYADPQQLTENDKQFAACLASPPDLEEAPHSFTFSRPTFEQRAGSGLLTMTLSMRQRQGSQKQQQDDDAAEDDTAVAPDAFDAVDSSNKQQQHDAVQRQGSLLVLQRTSSITGSGSSFSQRLQPWHTLRNSLHTTPAAAAAAVAAAAAGKAAAVKAHSWADAAGTIPEDAPAEYVNNSSSNPVQDSATARDQSRAADQHGAAGDADARLDAALSQLRSRSILRLESFSVDGRRQLQEVPVAAAPGANALACLMGFGYMVLHTWQARTEPATGLLGKHVEALAGTGHLKNRLVM